MFWSINALIALLALLVGSPNGSQADETCHLREFDACMSSAIVFVQQPQGVKMNEAELDRQCALFKETEECLENFEDRCMTPTQNSLVDFMSGGLLQYMRDYCHKGTELRRLYLKHADCVNRERKNSNKCLIDFQAAIERSSLDETHWRDRPKVLCCAMDRMKDCSSKIVGPACGQESLAVADMLIKGTFSRGASLTCSKYKHTSATCKALLPPPGTKPKGTKSRSVLSRLIGTITNV